MTNRLIAVMLVTAGLAGCFGGSGSSGSTSAASGSTGASAAAAATATSHPLIFQGTMPSGGVAAGENYLYQPSLTSASATVTYAIEGQPTWASFDTTTGVLSGTPSASDAGVTGDVIITASDGSNTGSIGPFSIRVFAAAPTGNDVPPTVAGSAGASVIAGQPYSFQPTAGDAAGKPLSYAVANLPPWAVFSTVTGQLLGTPAANQVGTYQDISVRVSDGTLSVTLPAFSITVTQGSADMPVIGGTPSSSVVSGQAYSFQPTASDPNSKTLTFSATNLPSWATLDPGTGKLAGTPSAAQTGTYANIVIAASNGSSSASLAAFTITVTAAAANAPTLSGSPATSVVVGKMYSFKPVASDPQGMALTFSVVNLPVWATFDSATGLLSGTPTGADIGDYPTIGISVTDGVSAAQLPSFSIVVSSAVTVALSLSGNPATAVVAGSAYQFTPTMADSSGALVTFTVQNAPSWATFNASTGELSGTPSEADVGTYSGITISASDGQSTVSLPTFPISVTQTADASVNLSWTPPTENTNGSALTNLAGYWIYYGPSAGELTHSVQIKGVGVTSYVVSNLSPGTWYFSMTAYTTASVQSASSAVASGTAN
jgi:nitrite reductase/ring-hydroxylating ferredoxin subunit